MNLLLTTMLVLATPALAASGSAEQVAERTAIEAALDVALSAAATPDHGVRTARVQKRGSWWSRVRRDRGINPRERVQRDRTRRHEDRRTVERPPERPEVYRPSMPGPY